MSFSIEEFLETISYKGLDPKETRTLFSKNPKDTKQFKLFALACGARSTNLTKLVDKAKNPGKVKTELARPLATIGSSSFSVGHLCAAFGEYYLCGRILGKQDAGFWESTPLWNHLNKRTDKEWISALTRFVHGKNIILPSQEVQSMVWTGMPDLVALMDSEIVKVLSKTQFNRNDRIMIKQVLDQELS
jgi:hypothetical protein